MDSPMWQFVDYAIGTMEVDSVDSQSYGLVIIMCAVSTTSRVTYSQLDIVLTFIHLFIITSRNTDCIHIPNGKLKKYDVQ